MDSAPNGSGSHMSSCVKSACAGSSKALAIANGGVVVVVNLKESAVD